MCTFAILSLVHALASCYVLYTEMVQVDLHVYTVVWQCASACLDAFLPATLLQDR